MPESPSMKAAQRIQRQFPEIGTLYVPDIAAIIKSDAEQAAWNEAIAALVSAQEQVVLVGKQGRSARNAEMVRRQAIYIRGWDDARAALVAARDKKGEKRE